MWQAQAVILLRTRLMPTYQFHKIANDGARRNSPACRNRRSFLACDDDGFAPDTGLRERAVEGAARFLQAGALKTEIELLPLIVAGPAQGGVVRVIQSHQQEEFHRKAGIALGDLETLARDQLRQGFEVEIIQMMGRGYPPFGKRKRRAGSSLEGCEIIGHVEADEPAGRE